MKSARELADANGTANLAVMLRVAASADQGEEAQRIREMLRRDYGVRVVGAE